MSRHPVPDSLVRTLTKLFNGLLKSRPELNYGVLHVAVALAAAALCYHLVDFPVRHKMAEHARRARA